MDRTWTDEQLREAVASNHSWRGVTRALGLAGLAISRTARQRADELELDASHFRGQRTFSDERLRDAVAASSSWNEVSRRLGLAAATSQMKAHAARLQLDVSNLLHPREVSFESPFAGSPAAGTLSETAEHWAAAWFVSRGHAVSWPASGKSPYDLVVEAASVLYKVQVKTTTNSTGPGAWAAPIRRVTSPRGRTIVTRPYDPLDVDYFFIVTGDGRGHVIPMESVVGRMTVTVRQGGPWDIGLVGPPQGVAPTQTPS